MHLTHKPPLAEGIRERYREWLRSDKRAYLKLRAFGIGPRRAKVIALQGRVPSLREALVIDCCTNGECNVYSWVDTEWMEQRSNADNELQANALWAMWPKPILQEHRQQLRLSMVQRLGSPDRNALAIVTKLGNATIAHDARQELAARRLSLPPIVDEDWSDEQVRRAIERHERRRARANAYVKGKRASLDT